MREYRRRRRHGFRAIRVLLHETEIGALIEKGYLSPAARYDHDALQIAINEFIDCALGPPRQGA
jgi:hypothetical protein